MVLNKDSTKFLVVRKDPRHVTDQYLMPGGKFEEETPEECIKNEIKEELDCTVDFRTLEYIGEYTDVAAGRPDRRVRIELYTAKLIGEPRPSTEIVALHWIGAEDINNPKVSPIIRNKIIPDLVERGILKQKK